MIKKHRPRLYLTALALTSQAMALLLAGMVAAQDTTTQPESKTTVVTGTYLESADAAGTLTVTPVELTEPINQGYSTVEDVLRTKLPQYGGPGNLNPAFGNGGDGNSYLALRGLPGNATLVLVNGRRTAVSALNLIPDAAVEKIEILNDGGSAIYGSDAVAGVVNIILKKNFQGTKLSASEGFATQAPHINERRFQLLSGDTTEKGSFVISAEYQAAEGLYSPDRQPSNTSRGTSGTGNPGTISPPTIYDAEGNPTQVGLPWHVNQNVTRGLTSSNQIPAGFNPAAYIPFGTDRNAAIAASNALLGADSPVLYGNGPRFPYPQYTTLYRPYQKYDFSGSGEYKLINDAVKFFGEAYYVNYNSQVQLAPSPLTGLSIPANNYWMQQVFPGATSRLNQNYRIVELGPRIYNDEFQDFRFVGGLRGEIPDTTWKWEFGYLFANEQQNETAQGGVVMSKLNDLLGTTDSPTAWNPFGYTPIGGGSTVNNVGALADKGYIAWITRVQGIDFNTSGKVIDLPGGEARVALGFAERRESFDQQPDLAMKDGLIQPFNTYPAYGANRTIWGGYLEGLVPIFGKDFNIPAFYEFSVSAAVRDEDYDDVGNTHWLPRVSGRWKPFEFESLQNFSIRGSWAKGFSAPSFSDLYSPPGQNFIEVFNPFTQVYEQPTEAVLEVGNRDLKPTTAETWLVGGEYALSGLKSAPKAVRGLTFGADYYHITQDGIPFSSADYSVAQWASFGGYTNLNNPWGPNAVRSAINPAGTQVEYDLGNNQLLQIRNQSPINAGTRKTDGIDIQIAETFETDAGTFTVSGLATRVLSFEQQDVAGAGFIDYLGRYWGSGSALADTGYPQWRMNATLSWNYKRYTAAFGVNYTEGYDETFNDANRTVEDYITFDLRLGYKIPYVEADLLVGVNNLFNETAPAVFSSFENNLDRAIGDPRNRMIYIALSKTF